MPILQLSDFPPEQKGEIWGIKQYCDAIVGSEEEGALKPSPVPFQALSKKLEVPVEQILYVGNSHKYDILGPKKIGMKAAWFVTKKSKLKSKKAEAADFTFYKYSQLEEYIFGKK